MIDCYVVTYFIENIHYSGKIELQTFYSKMKIYRANLTTLNDENLNRQIFSSSHERLLAERRYLVKKYNIQCLNFRYFPLRRPSWSFS